MLVLALLELGAVLSTGYVGSENICMQLRISQLLLRVVDLLLALQFPLCLLELDSVCLLGHLETCVV